MTLCGEVVHNVEMLSKFLFFFFFFLTLNTTDIFDSRGITSGLSCLLCMLYCCTYICGETDIITHIVTLNLVWAAEQVIELFLPALCRTLFMFSLSWNVNWVPPCAETLASPAASILPSKRSNFKSAHGAQCRIKILQHLADARGIFSVHSIVAYLQRNRAPTPAKKRKKSCCLPIIQSKWRSVQSKEEPNI